MYAAATAATEEKESKEGSRPFELPPSHARASPTHSDRAHSPYTCAQARRIFNIFDTDGSGAMDFSELFKALRLMGLRVRPHETSNFLSAFDSDGSGTLNFPEFCRFLQIDV